MSNVGSKLVRVSNTPGNYSSTSFIWCYYTPKTWVFQVDFSEHLWNFFLNGPSFHTRVRNPCKYKGLRFRHLFSQGAGSQEFLHCRSKQFLMRGVKDSYGVSLSHTVPIFFLQKDACAVINGILLFIPACPQLFITEATPIPSVSIWVIKPVSSLHFRLQGRLMKQSDFPRNVHPPWLSTMDLRH